MEKNNLRECFQSNNIAHGIFSSLSEPSIIEMMGYAGYDFTIIDMEHNSLGMHEIQNMIRAAEISNITPIVRVSYHNPGEILRAAELGAKAVLVPHIRNSSETSELVKLIKFPPYGQRGMSGSTRAAKFGYISMNEHMKKVNKDIMAMVMIEDREAVENLKEILEVEGLDAIFIGPSDLSREYGVPGQTNHPKVMEIVEHIFNIAKDYPHIKIGIPSFVMNDVPERVNLGADFITCPPSDVSLIFKSLKDFLEKIKKTYIN